MKVLVKLNSEKNTLVMTNVKNMEVVFDGSFYELHIDERVIDSSITNVIVRCAQRVAYHPTGADEGVYMGECGTHYIGFDNLYDMISEIFESDNLYDGYFDIRVVKNDNGCELTITFINTAEIDEYYTIESYTNTMYSYYGQDDESKAIDATNIDKVMASIEKAKIHRESFLESYKKRLLINK